MAVMTSKIVSEGKDHNRNNLIATRLPIRTDCVTKIKMRIGQTQFRIRLSKIVKINSEKKKSKNLNLQRISIKNNGVFYEFLIFL